MSLHEVLKLLFVGLAQAAGCNQVWPGTIAKEMHGIFLADHLHQKRLRYTRTTLNQTTIETSCVFLILSHIFKHT